MSELGDLKYPYPANVNSAYTMKPNATNTAPQIAMVFILEWSFWISEKAVFKVRSEHYLSITNYNYSLLISYS